MVQKQKTKKRCGGRRSRRSHTRRRNVVGGRRNCGCCGTKRTVGRGWTTGPGYVGTPGNLARVSYPTEGGQNCPMASVVRPGYIQNLPQPSGVMAGKTGGRYQNYLGVLNPSNGVGTIRGATSIPCERSHTMSGGVEVGRVDSMRYYAPTAGYSFAPSNNPGMSMAVPYEARHLNKACSGGKKRRSRKH